MFEKIEIGNLTKEEAEQQIEAKVTEAFKSGKREELVKQLQSKNALERWEEMNPREIAYTYIFKYYLYAKSLKDDKKEECTQF